MKYVLHIRTLALLLLTAGALPLFAQQVALDVQPRVLRANEAATLTLTFINLNPPQAPALPALPHFDITYTGQEQQFQWTNGDQQRRLTYRYQLVPHGPGQFTLGPFTMNVAGQPHDFEAIPIEVLPPADPRGGTAPSTTPPAIDELVFARILLPRNEVFLQERFDVDLALYYRGVQLDRGIQLQNMPATGLHLEDFQEIAPDREAIGNEIYDVRRFRLRGTALTAGAFELAPFVRVNVLVRRENSPRTQFGMFDHMLFGGFESQALSVPAEPITVTIRPLPDDGRPENFSGAVGRFDMQLAVKPTEVQAGEPVTLTLRITGTGNFETISMPPLDLGPEFRRYDPKLIAGDRSFKEFEQVFIPRSESVTEIPPVTFSYFDPEAAAYRTLVRGPTPLAVTPGAAAAPHLVQAPATGPADARPQEPLGIDLVDLKRTASPTPARPIAAPSPRTLGLHALPALALAALALVRHRRERLHRDVVRHRRSLAPSSARAALRRAEQALAAHQTTPFHDALWQALADYLAHRDNLPAGAVTPDSLLAAARRDRLPDPTLAALEHLLRTCDEARFSRGGLALDPAAARALIDETQTLLRAWEKAGKA